MLPFRRTCGSMSLEGESWEKIGEERDDLDEPTRFQLGSTIVNCSKTNSIFVVSCPLLWLKKRLEKPCWWLPESYELLKSRLQNM